MTKPKRGPKAARTLARLYEHREQVRPYASLDVLASLDAGINKFTKRYDEVLSEDGLEAAEEKVASPVSAVSVGEGSLTPLTVYGGKQKAYRQRGGDIGNVDKRDLTAKRQERANKFWKDSPQRTVYSVSYSVALDERPTENGKPVEEAPEVTQLRANSIAKGLIKPAWAK